MSTQNEVVAKKILSMLTKPRKKEESPEDISAVEGSTRHTISFRDYKLAAYSWGTGAPVLLLHGWESRGSRMTGFVRGLVNAGLQPIALDAPAHGNSTGDEVSVIAYGEAVVVAAAYFGSVAGVIAHSLGSAAALYAFAHGVKVQASVHMCGPASLTRVIERAGVMGNLDKNGMEHLKTIFSENIGMPLQTMDLDILLAGMAHPALILHDPEDLEIPLSESQALATAWQGSRLQLVTGLGHRKIINDPRVIGSATSFIEATVNRDQPFSS